MVTAVPTTQANVAASDLRDFLTLAQSFIGQTLHANRRADGLLHTYNVLRLEAHGAAVENLYLMLEGQVALLSSGMLQPDEALSLLNSLRNSDLYRADQHSYMLYPNRKLPGFLQKNNVAAEKVAGSALVHALMNAGDESLLVQDTAGVFHFNGRFRNANNVNEALDKLAQKPAYSALVTAERESVLDLFEATFNHHAFTGRSGTFFAYEGLGSIYWHMVSKLLLAAQECYQQAVDEGSNSNVIEALSTAYYDIRAGIGFNKTPDVYGAFPTDPYSHTPMGSGARQPGMTGQVKEEILTRLGELGVSMRQGKFCFAPTLLQPGEFLPDAHHFNYVDLAGDTKTLSLPPNSLAFTICQTPVVYKIGEVEQVEVVWENGRSVTMPNNCLDEKTTQHIINRDGLVKNLYVTIRMREK